MRYRKNCRCSGNPISANDYRSGATNETTPKHIWLDNVIGLAGVTHDQSKPYGERIHSAYLSGEPAWMAASELQLRVRQGALAAREGAENYGMRRFVGRKGNPYRRKNPPETFDTCPSYMDYDWWVQHYAPEHVHEAARAKALAEAQRLYAPPPMTSAERAQVEREEAAYGRAMRRERKNPGVEQVVLLVLPYVIKSLGNKVSAFNGLSQSERERRVREFLRGSQRHLMGPAGSLLGPQAAKSDKIVRAIVVAVERHGGHAVQAGGEAATARLTPATRNPRRR